MSFDKILHNYSSRIPTLSAYYFLVSNITDKQIFSKNYGFNQEEAFNLTMEFLLFIFHKSIKREHCLKEDLISFIEELNLRVYKKDLSCEKINALVGDLINNLANKGKVYNFTYFNHDTKTIEQHPVRLLVTKDIKQPNGSYVLSYNLTTECYKLLLTTKEYDDIFGIKVHQIVARLRIQEGNFLAAKGELQDIIYKLNIQHQSIDEYLKAIKGDVYYSRISKFTDLFSNSLSTLEEEMTKYEELGEIVNGLIQDKETYVNDAHSDERIKEIRNAISQLKDLVIGIREVKIHTSNLIDRIQKFRIEYNEIFDQMLKSITISKFDFKDVILGNIESNNVNIENLSKLYSSLFLPKIPNIFYLDTPYKEQRIIKDNLNKDVEVDDDWYELDKTQEIEKQQRIEFNESFYYNFMKYLFLYGEKHTVFTLKEFLNYYISEKRSIYMDLTSDSKLLRDLLLNLVGIENVELSKVKEDLNKTTFTQMEEFQIERIIELMIQDINDLDYRFKELHIDDLDYTITINTEIDLKEWHCETITVPDLKFTFTKPY